MKNNLRLFIKENCNIRTNILSISMSASICAGVVFALNALIIAALSGKHHYPVQYPVSVIVAVAAVIFFAVFLSFYLRIKRKRPSKYGTAIDVAWFLITLPMFYYLFIWIINSFS